MGVSNEKRCKEIYTDTYILVSTIWRMHAVHAFVLAVMYNIFRIIIYLIEKSTASDEEKENLTKEILNSSHADILLIIQKILENPNVKLDNRYIQQILVQISISNILNDQNVIDKDTFKKLVQKFVTSYVMQSNIKYLNDIIRGHNTRTKGKSESEALIEIINGILEDLRKSRLEKAPLDSGRLLKGGKKNNTRKRNFNKLKLKTKLKTKKIKRKIKNNTPKHKKFKKNKK